MKTLIRHFLCAGPLALASIASHAADPNLPPQDCSDSALAVVGQFLKVDHFSLDEGVDAADRGVITSAACKRHPVDKRLTIVSAAYQGDDQNAKALVIALVDEDKKQVAASYRGAIEEGADMQVHSGSLRVDTPPYILAPGVRAFGLDLSSAYIPHCAEGGWGVIRTLYVQEGPSIRPILEDVTMSQWAFVRAGESTCGDSEGGIENVKLSLSMSDTITKGYRDIIVTATSTRDDGIPRTPPRFRDVIHYDGSSYPTPGTTKALERWRGEPLEVKRR